MNFVTDTHALLWWFTDNSKISLKARKIFEKCENGENIIFIPSIVMAEAISIFDKKRISFDFRKLLKQVNDSEHFMLAALDYPILQNMIDLSGIPELHDKIIAATARCLNLPLITKDKVLQNMPHVKTVW